MTKDQQRLFYFSVFLIYLAIVLRLTVFRFDSVQEERLINLTLFADLINIYQDYGINLFLYLFLGNIAWFLPFGFLLPIILHKESFKIVIISGFLFSFNIETVQYFFRVGVAEIDDLILNTAGVAIGYCFYKFIFKKILPSWQVKQYHK